MKKKTSILMLMLVAIMAITLVGCGKSDETTKTETTEPIVIVEPEDEDIVEETEATEVEAVEPTEEETVVEEPVAKVDFTQYVWDPETHPNNGISLYLTDESGQKGLYALFGDGPSFPTAARPLGTVGSKIMYQNEVWDGCSHNESVDGHNISIILEAGLDNNFTALRENRLDESVYHVFDNLNFSTNHFWLNEVVGVREDLYGVAVTTDDADEIAAYKELTGYTGDITIVRYYVYSTLDGYTGLEDERMQNVDFNYDIYDGAFTITYVLDNALTDKDLNEFISAIINEARF